MVKLKVENNILITEVLQVNTGLRLGIHQLFSEISRKNDECITRSWGGKSFGVYRWFSATILQ